MAEVTGKTSNKIDELIQGTVTSGRVQDGQLILITAGGAEILAGDVSGGQPAPGTGTPYSYDDAAPGSIFAIHRDALTGDWPSSRPSARTDLVFDLTGVDPSPSWITSKDRRSIPVGENGLVITPEDLENNESPSGNPPSGPQTYENALPTSIFIIHRDATTGEWPASRPSARTDIVFECVGADPSPPWLANRDRRGIPKS